MCILVAPDNQRQDTYVIGWVVRTLDCNKNYIGNAGQILCVHHNREHLISCYEYR